MKNLLLLLFSFPYLLLAQKISFENIQTKLINLQQVEENNEDFAGYEALDKLLKDVEVVMLGEQSHMDGTTITTKIKLIKYLHQKLDFDIIAFEASFYECAKAWSLIKDGQKARNSLAKSVFALWSCTKEFEALANYIEAQSTSERPLIVTGFDNQFTGKLGAQHFVDDLSAYLTKKGLVASYTRELEQLKASAKLVGGFYSNRYKKKEAARDIAFLDKLIAQLEKTQENVSKDFWIQNLKSTRSYLADLSNKEIVRDKMMAENLIWLKEKYPDKKIICWGATSHFLFNSSEIRIDKNLLGKVFIGKYYEKNEMMGQFVKDALGDKLYTIGFLAYQGKYGLFGKGKKIDVATENSVGHLIGQSNYSNCLLPLKGLSFADRVSRPLAHIYTKGDIAKVMDAVIFNRNMQRPDFDRNFYLGVYPENKWLKPEETE